MKWYYKWTEINARLGVYLRFRLENTLDGFDRPYTEILAFVHAKEEKGRWEWHAYRHVGERVEEMDMPSTLLFTVQKEVEMLLTPNDVR